MHWSLACKPSYMHSVSEDSNGPYSHVSLLYIVHLMYVKLLTYSWVCVFIYLKISVKIARTVVKPQQLLVQIMDGKPKYETVLKKVSPVHA